MADHDPPWPAAKTLNDKRQRALGTLVEFLSSPAVTGYGQLPAPRLPRWRGTRARTSGRVASRPRAVPDIAGDQAVGMSLRRSPIRPVPPSSTAMTSSEITGSAATSPPGRRGI